MLLECVPNLSEGRRPAVVRSLAEAVAAPGVHLLDLHSDADHDRSVLTLAGEPGDLREGLLRLYEAALTRVDLRVHRGVHPRLGAVDVVPFVPLRGATMDDAVECAERLGEEVARRFGLPVYLYEEAARRAERRALPEIRRGGFEGLAAKLALPEWLPDFGPPAPHPTAGATVIGARFFLIAFNLVLAPGADLELARAIARRTREQGGGLPRVRAIGVWLGSRARAQVSLNLLDYRVTSMAAAHAHVARLAREAGTMIESSEVVGLLPRAALPADPGALRLELPETRVLEHQLARCGLG